MRQRFFQMTVGFVILAVAICMISVVQNKMIEIRDNEILHQTDVPLRDAPWHVAVVTVAMGGFRGLLADVLFLRSEAMKEREQYFEMVQLAWWITALQPRFTGAQAFLAWNMSYNVSVNFSDHADRWRWVSAGIELLRDGAIIYNPNDPKLYKELGWIYQHKLGNILDDAHRYYKVQLASQMMIATGSYREIQWRPLAEAPQTPAELWGKLGPEKTTALKTVLAKHEMSLNQFEVAFRESGGRATSEEMANDLNGIDVWMTMSGYLYSRWVHQVYKIDPAYVVKLQDEYGPIDFRLPEAHAVYWARKGLEHAPGGMNVDCRRMVGQSLRMCFQSGKLLFISQEGIPFVGANVEIVDAASQAFLDNADMFENNRSFLSGYENFLKDTIVQLYVAGDRNKASEYLDKLKEQYPTNPVYKAATVDAFALKEMGQDISGKSLKQIENMVAGLLRRYYMALAVDDDEGAVMALWIAKQIEAKHNAGRKPDSRIWNRVAVDSVGNKELREAVLVEVLFSLPPELAGNLRARCPWVTDERLEEIVGQLRSAAEAAAAPPGQAPANE